MNEAVEKYLTKKIIININSGKKSTHQIFFDLAASENCSENDITIYLLLLIFPKKSSTDI